MNRFRHDSTDPGIVPWPGTHQDVAQGGTFKDHGRLP
jgi:hypothetical protein